MTVCRKIMLISVIFLKQDALNMLFLKHLFKNKYPVKEFLKNVKRLLIFDYQNLTKKEKMFFYCRILSALYLSSLYLCCDFYDKDKVELESIKIDIEQYGAEKDRNNSLIKCLNEELKLKIEEKNKIDIKNRAIECAIKKIRSDLKKMTPREYLENKNNEKVDRMQQDIYENNNKIKYEIKSYKDKIYLLEKKNEIASKIIENCNKMLQLKNKKN
jgi:hypothetical protein